MTGADIRIPSALVWWLRWQRFRQWAYRVTHEPPDEPDEWSEILRAMNAEDWTGLFFRRGHLVRTTSQGTLCVDWCPCKTAPAGSPGAPSFAGELASPAGVTTTERTQR